MNRNCLLLAVALAFASFARTSEAVHSEQPLAHAHAHNDYWHERPLFDALERGFTSVEADVFLVDGKLLVGHEAGELKPERSLESLYLAPLAKRVHEIGGRVFSDGDRFFLLVDVKSEAESTYQALDEVLSKYAEMLTSVDDGKVQARAVTVVISGNRATETMAKAKRRFAGVDGRLSDLDGAAAADLMPMISDTWAAGFSWNGEGPMPAGEREKLATFVRKAHAAGRVLRFWSTPDSEGLWRELRAAGVDLIGSDQLDRLAGSLRSANRGSQNAVKRVDLSERPPLNFKLVAKLGPGPRKENSGIVKSRQYPDVFWIENDSGDEPRIYPVNRRGENYADTRYGDEQGVLIGGAINVDWEDITVDAAGHVIVADLGNNENDRRDLVLYYLNEPSPSAGRTTVRQKIFLRYPDQPSFPAPRDNFNFDCEAVFTVDNTVYLLSKDRSDAYTTLYRLDDPKPEATNVLTRLDTFDVRGQAVGADCTPDGKRLAVLTYSGIWLFERESPDESFFDGRISWAPFPKRDAEAICFADDKTLLVADESLAELYEVQISDLTRVQ